MIEFSCEAIWCWALVLWEIFDHFNFSACNWVIHTFYFFLVHLGRLNFSKNLSFSSWLSILLAYSCLYYSLMMLCVSVLSIVTSPFSFLILLIWILPLFFLMSLAKGLSILFIFSWNQLLVFLIFTIISLIFFHLFLLGSLWFLSFY